YQRARIQRPQLAAKIDHLSASVPGSEMYELVVARSSRAAEQEVRSLPVPPDTLLVALRRGDRTMIPKGETRLLPGDRVIALVERGQLEELRGLFVRRPTEDETS
ncbi:MAG: hypothetical protein JXA57_01630, partial [Armatimonadetes bacterium]|nr:hypothetical protein [Armatimonadota bacterium]